MRKNAKNNFGALLFALGTLLFAGVIGFLAWLQLADYEAGVIDVYALQQDGYVQLVLDQINLIKDRDSPELVRDILGTLDASSNQYWTLSEQDTLMFVKDVLETNRYKGYTTATYFISESARTFIAALPVDSVTHGTIEIGTNQFVASGVRFEYSGIKYTMCLLTNSEIVLAQNSYLGAKINICVLALTGLAVFVINLIVLSLLIRKWRERYKAEASENEKLRGVISRLNDNLSYYAVYDPLKTVFLPKALPLVLRKLEKRAAWPITFVLLSYDTEECKMYFLRDSQLSMGRRVIKILIEEDRQIVLVLPKSQERGAEESVAAALSPGIQVVKRLTIEEKPESSLEDAYFNFYKKRVQEIGASIAL